MGGRGPWKSLPLPPPPRPPPRRPAAAAVVAAPPLLATAAAVSLCLHCLLTQLQLIPRGHLTVAVATAAGVAGAKVQLFTAHESSAAAASVSSAAEAEAAALSVSGRFHLFWAVS